MTGQICDDCHEGVFKPREIDDWLRCDHCGKKITRMYDTVKYKRKYLQITWYDGKKRREVIEDQRMGIA
ncbi:MAG: hypothetical protein GTN80_03720 [Nitrososphaeria archaeon]|nr:hypothetical protein [Nitrososphaeria archaeon]